MHLARSLQEGDKFPRAGAFSLLHIASPKLASLSSSLDRPGVEVTVEEL